MDHADGHDPVECDHRTGHTGASSGVGRQVAIQLATTGHDVILVARDPGRLAETVADIQGRNNGGTVRSREVDLGEPDEVRLLAQELADEQPSVVVSNAAAIPPVEALNSQGISLALAVNHLAPYLLMRSLVAPSGTRPTRFVVVGGSPSGLRRAPVDLDDLELRHPEKLGWPPSFRPVIAYARTKNMNTMFVYGLHARLPAGNGVTINGTHPGVISTTRLNRYDRGAARVFGFLTSRMSKDTVASAADRIVWLATDPTLAGQSGQYFVDRNPVDTASHTRDPERIDRLWRASAELVGLEP